MIGVGGRHEELHRTVAHLADLSGDVEIGSILSGRRAHLDLSGEALGTSAGQVIALTLARLLPRYCPQVSFSGASASLTPALRPLLGESEIGPTSLAALAARIWPNGSFTHAPASKGSVTIGVGRTGRMLDVGVGIDHQGAAQALRGRAAAIACAEARLPGMVAAALAAAGAARHLYPALLGAAPGDVCLGSGPSGGPLDLPVTPTLQRSHLVGVGAGGCAVVYALLCLEARGEIELLDPDAVDDSNLMRYILFDASHVGGTKSALAAGLLRTGGIVAEGHEAVLAEYLRRHPGERSRLETVICAVDSYRMRGNIAREIPRQILNAGTSAADFTVSRHGFNDGYACLRCLYPEVVGASDPASLAALALGLTAEEVGELMDTKAPVSELILRRVARHRQEDPESFTARRAGQPIDTLYNKAVCGGAAVARVRGEVFAPLAFGSALAGFLLAHAALDPTARPDRWFRADFGRHLEDPPLRGSRRVRDDCDLCSDEDYVEAHRRRWVDLE